MRSCRRTGGHPALGRPDRTRQGPVPHRTGQNRVSGESGNEWDARSTDPDSAPREPRNRRAPMQGAPVQSRGFPSLVCVSSRPSGFAAGLPADPPQLSFAIRIMQEANGPDQVRTGIEVCISEV
ncbi:hypothetical protein [Azospirillum palustre]